MRTSLSTRIRICRTTPPDVPTAPANAYAAYLAWLSLQRLDPQAPAACALRRGRHADD